MENKEINYVYILKCIDDSYYTGWTNNLEKRVVDHNMKKGAKYTKCRLPAVLVYFEEYTTKGEALKREIEIKKMTRDAKIKLIKNVNKV